MAKNEKQRLELPAPQQEKCDLDLHMFGRELNWLFYNYNCNVRMSMDLQENFIEKNDPKMSMIFKFKMAEGHVTYQNSDSQTL